MTSEVAQRLILDIQAFDLNALLKPCGSLIPGRRSPESPRRRATHGLRTRAGRSRRSQRLILGRLVVRCVGRWLNIKQPKMQTTKQSRLQAYSQTYYKHKLAFTQTNITQEQNHDTDLKCADRGLSGSLFRNFPVRSPMCLRARDSGRSNVFPLGFVSIVDPFLVGSYGAAKRNSWFSGDHYFGKHPCWPSQGDGSIGIYLEKRKLRSYQEFWKDIWLQPKRK